jgi:hypothetical protein
MQRLQVGDMRQRGCMQSHFESNVPASRKGARVDSRRTTIPACCTRASKPLFRLKDQDRPTGMFVLSLLCYRLSRRRIWGPAGFILLSIRQHNEGTVS